MKTIILSVALIVVCSMTDCKTKQNSTGVTNTGAPTIVYKTKADYAKFVPVTLSADRASILAYPSVQDIYYNGKLAYPSTLEKGFLLDNRGIGPNSAFLKITYEEYAKLNSIPSLTELYNKILEKDPFTEIYNLGDRSRFKNEVEEINHIIMEGRLKKFKKIK